MPWSPCLLFRVLSHTYTQLMGFGECFGLNSDLMRLLSIRIACNDCIQFISRKNRRLVGIIGEFFGAELCF